MTEIGVAEEALLAYLHEHHAVNGPYDAETDLIDSGQLDSLVVIDLVRFLASSFGIEMAPHEVSPSHFRSVRRLAEFVATRFYGKAA